MTIKEYLEIRNDDKYKDEVIEYNKALVKEYPFLKPKNVWTGKNLEEYDYSYTWLDDMPDGWRIAFGDALLKDLKSELEKINYLDKYQIVQIKEKFGGLRWYDNGCNEVWSRKILPKYEELSFNTCILCGKPAKYVSTGWISPYCKDCANKIFEEYKEGSRKNNFDFYFDLMEEQRENE